MTPLPRVSIVTPSFQQAAYLEQTLRSVLEQDYPNLEYMVVDGGSTDGSLEIIQRYAGRLAWWVSEPDRGQAEGINKGLRRASGEIVAWLNSDDLYLPGAIARAVQAFQAHPEVGLVFGDVRSIDSAGQVFNRMRYGPWGLAELMSFRIIGQPGVFMRRTVLEQAGYLDPAYHLLLDHQLWLRLACRAGMVYLPEDLAAARFHPTAKNVARAAEFGQEAYRIASWMENDAAFQPLYRQIRRRVWAGAHRLDAFYLLDSGQPGAALRAYWKSFWQHPATALADWKRIGYALFSPLGLDWARKAYLKRRKQRYTRPEPPSKEHV